MNESLRDESPLSESLLNDVLYSAWANQRVLRFCGALSREQLARDVGISHGGILRTLQHIYDGERVWLDCLRTPTEEKSWRLPTQPGPGLSLEALSSEWPRLWEGYAAWLRSSSDAGLCAEIILQLPEDHQSKLPRWKILRHVMNHSTLHRGQIVGMIRSLGHQPLNIDLMTYYGERRLND